MNGLEKRGWEHALTVGDLTAAKGHWVKWFKILHSSIFLAPKYNSEKKTFLNSEFLKVPSSHCNQSTLVTVTFIGQILYLSQSEISFNIINAESNFGVETDELF